MEYPSFYHYISPYMYTVCVCIHVHMCVHACMSVCVCEWERDSVGGRGRGRGNHGPYQDWVSDAQLHCHTHYTYQYFVGLKVNIVMYFEWKKDIFQLNNSILLMENINYKNFKM